MSTVMSIENNNNNNNNNSYTNTKLNLKNLTDEVLLNATHLKIKEETRITKEVLKHLAEIETRKLYLKRGYSSLFEMCIKEFKYSEGCALRRISSMRLMVSVPEVEEKLTKGKVNISTLSKLQSFIKKEEKIKNKKLNVAEKQKLIEVIENKSQRECELEFIKLEPMHIKTQERERLITEDLTEVKVIIDKKLKDKLDKLKNLLSHKNPNPNYAELIDMLSDIALKKLDPEQKLQCTPTSAKAVKEEPNTFLANKSTKNTSSNNGNRNRISINPHTYKTTTYIPSVVRQEL